MKLVDASPAALCNAFRYNYGDLEGCTMLLDIGAKTSNLLFFEKGKVYSRSINIGANSITQDFANEAKLKFPEAEAIKKEKGSVSLGGAYEEPEDPQAAAIAKIARQVMTRLHIQVNQTIQFFRGQQGGSAPQRLFLSGGASIMPFTAQFFAEKLNVSVEYFNPFRNIEIDPALDLEELSKYAHSFGEVVGLGLRDLAHCPVELNLMPKSSLQRQEFGSKKPYLVASVFGLALVFLAIYVAETRIAKVWGEAHAKLEAPLASLTAQKQNLQKALTERDQLKKQADDMKVMADNRFFWIVVFTDLRQVMIQAEKAETASLTMPDNGGTNTDEGVWVESFTPLMPPGYESGTQSAATGGGAGGFGGGRRRGFGGGDFYGGRRPGAPVQQMAPTLTPLAAQPASGSEVTNVMLLCRGINRAAQANSELAYSVGQFLTNSPSFTNPVTLGKIVMDDDTNTFTFQVTVNLRKHFKLQ
jgi:hypothetical protein